jgi:hypothetical protein
MSEQNTQLTLPPQKLYNSTPSPVWEPPVGTPQKNPWAAPEGTPVITDVPQMLQDQAFYRGVKPIRNDIRDLHPSGVIRRLDRIPTELQPAVELAPKSRMYRLGRQIGKLLIQHAVLTPVFLERTFYS